MPKPDDSAADPAAQLPPQIPFIIGNEACERFSFYGMRNILTAFLVGMLLTHLPEADREGAAKEVFHTFVAGVYFFPLLGGWISDRWFGKYRTILWLSLVYCAGHACLAAFEGNRTGFYWGLFLIAVGSGGIKPLVSSFVGDQFTHRNKHLAKFVYDAFYWTINFGSFFASLLMPRVLNSWGAAWAFGIPGLLMFAATVIFWLGRRRYVNVPPGPRDPDSFLAVVRTALAARPFGAGLTALATGFAAGLLGLWMFDAGSWPAKLGPATTFCLALGAVLLAGGVGAWRQLDAARGRHPDAAVDGARGVLRVLACFALISPFWSLFDQKASTWVLQGQQMAMPGNAWWWPGWLVSTPSQMQTLNPLLVMLLIPFNNAVLYPWLARLGVRPTPLRRMGWGIAFASFAWVVAGVLQLDIDRGAQVSIVWQAWPYLLLTFGEVLVSTTGLEFAYSQAPPSMKGAVMAFWSLSVTFGNLWVLLTNALVRNPAVEAAVAKTGLTQNAFLMFFFAGFALLAALAFAWNASRYPMQDHYRQA